MTRIAVQRQRRRDDIRDELRRKTPPTRELFH